MRAKKSLGQHFLKDGKTLERIVSAVLPNIPVIEIGPGKGALTKRLLAAGHRVIAIEKDHRLITPLEELFSNEIVLGQFRLIHGDALEDTPADIFGSPKSQYQVVANLPYYITGIYLRQSLEAAYQPTQMILLLQEEVVDRIVPVDGKESVLSIAVQVYGKPTKLVRVGRAKFSPVPRVDSAVLQISHISKQTLVGLDERTFFTILKQGFASKRKTLANNLREYPKIQQLVQEIGLDKRIRAERLKLADWLLLCRGLRKG